MYLGESCNGIEVFSMKWIVLFGGSNSYCGHYPTKGMIFIKDGRQPKNTSTCPQCQRKIAGLWSPHWSQQRRKEVVPSYSSSSSSSSGVTMFMRQSTSVGIVQPATAFMLRPGIWICTGICKASTEQSLVSWASKNRHRYQDLTKTFPFYWSHTWIVHIDFSTILHRH